MIRHCVFVKYRPEFVRADRDAIYADLKALEDRVAGMRSFCAGANVSPEGLGKGFDEGFIIDFVDAGARDAYLEHPDHQAIGSRIVAAAQGGTEGLLVFDLEF